MTDNSFIREVDEAVRKERYKALWDRLGIYIIGFVVVLIGGVALYKGWTYVQERKANAAGDEFVRALAFESDSDQTKANEAFEALSQDGPKGYRVLSRFQLASGQAKAGKIKEAVEAFETLAKDRSVDPILQGLATLQAATLRLDEADYLEMETRLDGLAEGTSAWRFSARDLLGLSAYQHKDYRAAEEQFTALLGDPQTPQNMRQRASMMLSLIVSHSTAPSSSTTN